MHDLSERDLEFIHALQISPRVTWTQAAEILNAHPTVLAQRWERLRGAGILWTAAETTGHGRRQVMSFTQLACIPSQRGEVTREVVRMPEVFSVDAFSQNHELALAVVGESMSVMAESTFDRIGSMPGVTKLQSALVVAMHSSAADWRLEALDRSQIAALRAIHRETTEPDPTITLRREHEPVVAMLQRNGRCSAADIARATGISPASARRYLSRVLHSDVLSLRCDMAQAHSGFPITVQWFTRLKASSHAAAAQALRQALNLRMVASTTGSSNFLITMWLGAVNDILPAERALESIVPDLELRESAVMMRPAKRLGWVLRPDSTATGELIAPPFPLD